MLMQLALVCRAWRPRAQLYLFRPVWLRSLESLWKLEAQLSLHSDFLPEIHGIHIIFDDKKGYPVRNLLSAVTTLARQCGNLRALSLFHRGFWSIRPGTPPHVYCIPFDPRSHSPLFRNSFCTITYLSLLGIHYRSDIDFLAFIFSFPALEKLSLEHVFCNSYRRIKEENYILLLKQRKGTLGKLRCLTMVCRPISRAVNHNRHAKVYFQDDMQPDVFIAILEILPNDGLQELKFALDGNNFDESIQ